MHIREVADRPVGVIVVKAAATIAASDAGAFENVNTELKPVDKAQLDARIAKIPNDPDWMRSQLTLLVEAVSHLSEQNAANQTLQHFVMHHTTSVAIGILVSMLAGALLMLVLGQ